MKQQQKKAHQLTQTLNIEINYYIIQMYLFKKDLCVKHCQKQFCVSFREDKERKEG